MTNSFDGEDLQPDSKGGGSVYGSRLFPRVMQKPIGVGSFVGLLTGVANSIILSIPLLFSVPVGVLLGMAVCVIACPGMRNDLAQHKKSQASNASTVTRSKREKECLYDV